MSTEQTDTRSFRELQRDAGLEKLREQAAERRRVEDIVLGNRSSRGRRVTEVIRIADGDYLVQVEDNDGASWTTVVGGERSGWFHLRQDDAILHLIAARYDDNSNSQPYAVHYAGRLLGVPSSE